MMKTECYSRDQIELMLEHTTGRSPVGSRNKAIICLLYGAGLKLQEVLNLKPNDLEMTELGLNIIVSNTTKGYARIVVLGMQAEELKAVVMIQTWIDERAFLGYQNDLPLFCTKEGKQMSPDYIRDFFSRLNKKIEKSTGDRIRIHSHGFRITRAKFLFDTGYGIEHIQDQLGYDSDCWFLQNMIQHM